MIANQRRSLLTIDRHGHAWVPFQRQRLRVELNRQGLIDFAQRLAGLPGCPHHKRKLLTAVLKAARRLGVVVPDQPTPKRYRSIDDE